MTDTPVEVMQVDRERAHEWMREQTTAMQMMFNKPRGLYEAFARHRIAAQPRTDDATVERVAVALHEHDNPEALVWQLFSDDWKERYRAKDKAALSAMPVQHDTLLDEVVAALEDIAAVAEADDHLIRDHARSTLNRIREVRG